MMLIEREAESCYLGQFIPIQYHHNMLMDSNRMDNFKAAIQYRILKVPKFWNLVEAPASSCGLPLRVQ